MNYILRRKGVGEKIGDMAEYSTTGLSVVRSDAIPSDPADVVIRWGTTSSIPSVPGQVVLNKADAIHTVYDKRGFRKAMADKGLAPKTWVDFADLLDDDDTPIDPMVQVMIVRPDHHIRSLDLNVCSSLSDVYRATKKYDKYYISEYIKKDKEFRIFCAGGRVIAVVEKIPTNKDDVSWGCVDQGEFKYIPWTEWPLYALEVAVQAFQMSGLDFGAVDLVSQSTGLSSPRAYVLEINTAPELTPYYRKTFTKYFDYVVQNGRQSFPITQGHGYKGYIHPAVAQGTEKI